MEAVGGGAVQQSGSNALVRSGHSSTDALVLRVDPTAGLVAAQQEAWHNRLNDDRKMIYYDKQRQWSELLRSSKDEDSPKPVPELPPEVVQEILDSVTVDPGEELAERRDARLGESLALHLERLLCCGPPAALRSRLGEDCADIRFTEALPPMEPGDPHLVLFQAPPGAAPAAWRLRRRLNAASPALGAALARRMMLAVVPGLRFELRPGRFTDLVRAADGAVEGASPRASPLWRVAKRARRMTVHKAASSFGRHMGW